MEKALTTHTDTQPRADGTEDILAGTNLNLAEARPYSPALKLPRAINFQQILNNKRNFGEVEKKTGNFHPSRLAERHATPNDRPTTITKRTRGFPRIEMLSPSCFVSFVEIKSPITKQPINYRLNTVLLRALSSG